MNPVTKAKFLRLKYMRSQGKRHLLHYYWNQSRFNKKYDPFISSCNCCCSRCDRDG